MVIPNRTGSFRKLLFKTQRTMKFSGNHDAIYMSEVSQWRSSRRSFLSYPHTHDIFVYYSVYISDLSYLNKKDREIRRWLLDAAIVQYKSEPFFSKVKHAGLLEAFYIHFTKRLVLCRTVNISLCNFHTHQKNWYQYVTFGRGEFTYGHFRYFMCLKFVFKFLMLIISDV